MKQLVYIILCLFAVLTACKESDLFPARDESFQLIAQKSDQPSTRTGDPNQVAYLIYAFQHQSGSPDGVDYQHPFIDKKIATAAWGQVMQFQDQVNNRYGNHSLDFYGLTYGNNTWEDDTRVGTGANYHPIYTLTRDATSRKLPDLMAARLLNQTVGASDLELVFGHALAQLQFTAARQVPETTDNLLGTYIQTIKICDYLEATLDLTAREWTSSSALEWITVYSYNPDGGEVPEDKKLTDTPKNIGETSLVFPRSSGKFQVQVTAFNPLKNQALSTNFEIDLSKIDNGEGFSKGFSSNFQYTLAISVINEGIKIILLEPKMYAWIEEDEDKVMELGQPITFSSITWSDRNLGATSTTHNNIREWDDMRGYYYQWGRNVPYFVLKNRIIGNTAISNQNFDKCDYTFSESWVAASTDKSKVALAPYALIHNGSLQEAYQAATDYRQGSGTWNVVGKGIMPLAYWTSRQSTQSSASFAMDVSDYDPNDPTRSNKNRYAIVNGTYNDDNPWWTPKETAPTTWDEPETQPCPKGWRIPTKDDWASIMPLGKRTGDITFHPGSSYKRSYTYTDRKGETRTIPNFGTGDNNNEMGNHYGATVWYERGGDRYNIKVNNDANSVQAKGLAEELGDPFGEYETDYLCVRKNTSEIGTLYAIKCQGTSAAYRLRWEYKIHSGWSDVNNTSYQKKAATLVISRYPATAQDELKNTTDLAKFTDWDNPVEVMELPCCGYIYTDGVPKLTNIGIETLYACSTRIKEGANKGYYYVVRIKACATGGTGSRYIWLGTMRRAYGMNVRPVRDNSVTVGK